MVATGSSSPGSPRAGVLAAIGNTPAVQLMHLVEPDMAEVWVKLEAANPTGSYKDRMALAMIEGAERPGGCARARPVVEYTGGTTGSSLAFVCAVKGYPLRIVTSDAFADEKLRTMEAFGADVEIIASPAGHHTRPHPPHAGARQGAGRRDSTRYQTDQFTDTRHGRRATAHRGGGRAAGRRRDRRAVLLRRHGRLLPGREPGAPPHHPAMTRVAVEPAESAVLSGGSPGHPPHRGRRGRVPTGPAAPT